MDLLERLQEHRRQEQCLSWQGTFAEYFELVRADPHLANHAHGRLYDMIVSHGVKDVGDQKRFCFFSEDLFGLDEALQRLVEEYFHSAARRLDVRKRILLLMGPVSGGKSTIVTLLKRGLESYSRTDAGAVYAIKGCPMHEDPLHLVPSELRSDVERKLGVTIEGSLCPACRVRLRDEYDGIIEDVLVHRVALSEENRVGIGTFQPSDPKSQDIAELTGSIDFAAITEYGAESDPRAYRFDGELNIANRGVLEMQEMLKMDEKFLWHLLSLSQEGNFKAGRFALISADEVIIAHTNEEEYRHFIANKKNEALHSRMIVMPIPYNLRVSDEVRIYQKLVKQSALRDIHIAPHALHSAAMVSILSRLKQSSRQGVDQVKKMKLYDGEDMDGFKPKDIEDLKREFPDEGMSGIDPRYVINRLSSALVTRDSNCIGPLDVLRALRNGLHHHPSFSDEERENILNFIAVARQQYDELAKTEVQKAFVYSYEGSARTLFDNYLDNVEAYCNWQRVKDPLTGEELDPDEKLMRSIEEQIGVSDNAKKAFREEILIRISSYARRGRKFDYHSHERLREALEKKLFADMKDIIRVTTSVSNPDPDQLKRLNDVIARLVDDHGYCEICANEMLRYAGSLLNR